jgi:hypothetical protein
MAKLRKLLSKNLRKAYNSCRFLLTRRAIVLPIIVAVERRHVPRTLHVFGIVQLFEIRVLQCPLDANPLIRIELDKIL